MVENYLLLQMCLNYGWYTVDFLWTNVTPLKYDISVILTWIDLKNAVSVVAQEKYLLVWK